MKRFLFLRRCPDIAVGMSVEEPSDPHHVTESGLVPAMSYFHVASALAVDDFVKARDS